MIVNLLGCGTLGSYTLFNLMLKNLEHNNIEKINLIDYDTLEEKNLPYSILKRTEADLYIGHYKSDILRNTMIDYFEVPQSFIMSTVGRFPNCPLLPNGIIIDCRDSSKDIELANIKLTYDGRYGIINILPKSSKNPKESNKYQIGPSRYYAQKFSLLAMDYIFDPNKLSIHNLILIDLQDNQQYLLKE